MQRGLPERIEVRVRRFLAAGPPDLAGRRIVVAVSGGPDSVCLLESTSRVAERLDIELHVAHVHHGLRGRAADADAELARRHAERRGLAFSLLSADVSSYACEGGLSVEDAARHLRYDALESMAAACQAAAILVGHTTDDAAETVLINILRGTGPEGLAGIPERRTTQARREPAAARGQAAPLWVLRPLLGTRRSETAAYCSQRGLEVAFDETNLDARHLRNRVRHHLMPVLATYNPNVVEALVRLARLASEDQVILAELASRAFDGFGRVTADEVVLSWEGWGETPLPLRGRLLRLAVERLGGQAPSFAVLQAAERVLAKRTSGRRVALGAGLWVVTERRGIVVQFK